METGKDMTAEQLLRKENEYNKEAWNMNTNGSLYLNDPAGGKDEMYIMPPKLE